MSTTTIVTLGISPGTRHTGIAILSDNRWLRKAKIKTVRGVETAHRIAGVIKVIERIICSEGITEISVKINPSSNTSEFVEQIVMALVQLANDKSLPITRYRLVELHTLFLNKTQAENKESLAISLLQRFPELIKLYAKIHAKERFYYYIKAFEAVACACAVSKKEDWKYETL